MILRQLTLVVGLMTVIVCTWPRTTSATIVGFQPEDVFKLQWVSSAQVSPDGAWIVYVRNWMDIHTDRRRQELRIVDRDGAHDHLLIDRAGSYGQVQWSVDGKKLLLIGSEAGPAQIWIWSRADGTVRQVTTEPQPVSDARWSPDGSQIAFLERLAAVAEPTWFAMPAKPADADWAPPAIVVTGADFHMDASFTEDGATELPSGRRHLFVVSANGGRARQVTDGQYDEGEVAWSADGRSLYFCSDHVGAPSFPRRSQIYRVSAGGGVWTTVIDGIAIATAPALSRDGHHLAFTGVADISKAAGIAALYTADPDGKSPRSLSDHLDRNIAQFAWSADSRGIYVEYPDHGQYKMAVQGLDGAWRSIAEHIGPSDIGRPQAKGPSFSITTHGMVAFVYSDAETPGDLALTDSRTHRLTNLNRVLFQEHVPADVSPVSLISKYDGLPIQAWLYKPVGFDPTRRYPLVLFIHGGPWGTFSGDYFGAEPQIYAAGGYVVLAVNYRGSGGYGSVAENLNSQDFPGHDYDDLMSAVDWAVDQAVADPANLFVTGGSAGGELTAWIVGHTHRFRAAAVQKPVTDYLSEMGSTDQAEMYQAFFKSMPWQDPITYLHYSPIFYVRGVTTPTMLIGGESDLRTPIGQSEEFFEALKANGVDTALIRLPGAYHEYSRRPSQLITGALAVRGWFDAHRAVPSQP